LEEEEDTCLGDTDSRFYLKLIFR